MKISNFLKTHFYSIVLTFVDDFTLNNDNNKERLCWPLLAFSGLFGLCGLGCFFFCKNWPLLIKIRHNWPVSNSQISKLITKRDIAIWITVICEHFWFWEKVLVKLLLLVKLWPAILASTIFFDVSIIIEVPYALHYNPWFVYFLSTLRRPFLCFQGGFLRKFCPYVWLIFKSGLWWRACGI